MRPLTLLLNGLWIVFGGLWMAAFWLLAAVVMAISIIGLPWARAAFGIARYTLLPFGHRVIRRRDWTGEAGIGDGPLGMIGNLIWFAFAGWWLALGHLITAAGLLVSVIGIPFAWAHIKLAALALWPIGRVVVAEADLVRPTLYGR